MRGSTIALHALQTLCFLLRIREVYPFSPVKSKSRLQNGELRSQPLNKFSSGVKPAIALFIVAPNALDASNQILPTLLDNLDKDPQDISVISNCIDKLEQSYLNGKKDTVDSSDTVHDTKATKDNLSRFDQLVGLYDVKFVKTVKEGENPVGGKWTRKSGLAQKILSTRRTFQHILPVNATGIGSVSVTKPNDSDNSKSTILPVVGEAVNVISLDALWGLLRATIILRGDAVPLTPDERKADTNYQSLSPMAVRALFDAPRIIFGKTGRYCNLNVGPKSSVVLDTTYVDEKHIRIGLGGRSGSRFVFKRCAESDKEANEFRALLARKPWSKRKALAGLLSVTGLGVYYVAFIARGLASRILGASISTITTVTAALIAFSSGGIERDDQSVKQRKSFDEGKPFPAQ